MFKSILAYGVSLVPVFSAFGGFVLFLIAVSQYLQAQKWKKAEFLAKEMKEFYADPLVKKALNLIDWDSITFALIDGQQELTIDREKQAMALRPHKLLAPRGSDLADPTKQPQSLHRWFDKPEVDIRGLYDAFLDGLARFENYVNSDLIDAPEVLVYVDYWVARITAPPTKDDAAWRAALLTYISFYGFDKVLSLFDAFGRNIRPGSDLYFSYLAKMENQDFAKLLAGTLNYQYPSS